MSESKKDDIELDVSEIESKELQTKPDHKEVAVQNSPECQEVAVQTHGEPTGAETTGIYNLVEFGYYTYIALTVIRFFFVW